MPFHPRKQKNLRFSRGWPPNPLCRFALRHAPLCKRLVGRKRGGSEGKWLYICFLSIDIPKKQLQYKNGCKLVAIRALETRAPGKENRASAEKCVLGVKTLTFSETNYLAQAGSYCSDISKLSSAFQRRINRSTVLWWHGGGAPEKQCQWIYW